METQIKIVNDIINTHRELKSKLICKFYDVELYTVLNIIFSYINFISNFKTFSSEQMEILTLIETIYKTTSPTFMNDFTNIYIIRENIKTKTYNIESQKEISNNLKLIYSLTTSSFNDETQQDRIKTTILKNNIDISFSKDLIYKIEELNKYKNENKYNSFYVKYIYNKLEEITIKIIVQISAQYDNTTTSPEIKNLIANYFVKNNGEWITTQDLGTILNIYNIVLKGEELTQTQKNIIKHFILKNIT